MRPIDRKWLGAILLFFMSLIIGAAAPTIAHAQYWADVRLAGPFVVRADFSLSEYTVLLGELSQLQTDLSRSLGIHRPNERIDLYLFQSEKSYRAYLKRYYTKLPYRRALFIKENGPGKVLAHRNSEFAIDIRHECTHALLHAAMPMVPLWLDEGLAEYFELPPNKRAYDNPYQKSVKWPIRLGLLKSIERLEQEDDFTKMSRTDYRDSWAWVHFMLHGPIEAHHELIRYLADIQAHTPPGRLSRRLARRIPNPRSALAKHFGDWKKPKEERIAHR